MIYLALTHDWELRGDGSGDIEKIQFAPLRRLLQIYAKAGARTTILPDLMQQIRFRGLETKHPELKLSADLWDEQMRDASRKGHDIQLHLHPHWVNGRYESGRWQLGGDWSILNYDRDTAYAMLTGGKQYLEKLLQPVDPDYRCLAFRAGALAAAPSKHLFQSLVSLGIKLDVSVAGGLFANNKNLQLDYRNCEESFLPFYPDMEDARRVSRRSEEIVCVPLNHFYGSRRAVTRQNISLAWNAIQRKRSGANRANEPAVKNHSQPSRSPAELVYEKLIMPALQRKHFISDTGRLNYSLMREMLTSIRRRARDSGLTQVPIVLTNHPKDLRDVPAIERFVGEVAQADDIEFITLTEIVAKIQSGELAVRNAG